jgi:hypothetical protein
MTRPPLSFHLSLHGVTSIQATFRMTDGSACLGLIFSDGSSNHETTIYGDTLFAPKFQAFADAINQANTTGFRDVGPVL